MSVDIIYGWHVVNHVLLNNYKLIVKLFLYKKHKKVFYLSRLLNKYNINYVFVDLSFFTKILSNKNHQGIYAEINGFAYKSEAYLFKLLENIVNPLLLIFDSVMDSQNLGVCIRLSFIVGVDAIILPYNNSCFISNEIHKISCGVSLTIPIIKVVNVVRILNIIKKKNIYVLGTSEKAKISLYDENLIVSLAVIVGSECSGLRYLTMKNCDSIISIPVKGYVKSLNMAIATSVVLFEVLRQRWYNKNI
ncbi:MAG: 23S rRNA (guanosine(2251)-2'-O)-methyltransferase RlmB [Candidatus Azosocius agrarius]|nr:MAG: 23S rRNA (guanosine(2251)-2'-O)-methyltransferase RlmB [Gammaproteobacteria bacterium]